MKSDTLHTCYRKRLGSAAGLKLASALVIVFICGGWLVQTRGADTAAPQSKANVSTSRHREGTMLVDVLGRFKMTGDRATFYPLEGEVAYQGLENLGLERVAQLITENTDQLTWQVSGTVTEYRGDNFILVSKAVLQNQNEVADGVNSRPGARSRTPQRKTGYNSPKKS